ncbi:hypothetical protein BCR39DRAFT_219978 [Naematelia encephala]|uniref:Uncharacterized protein n=1 Tax=Naematelia encephala TaxID=71784 RepID=A0A1Y2AYY1_9TREE|nr:hypothetical protein BCR39DRAFT_219978 [Naematelia encephala]
MNQQPNVFTWLRCEWDNCSDEDSWSVKDLERHVLKVHVRPLRKTTCPFAGCPHIGSITDRDRHFLLQHANDQDSLTLPRCAEPGLADALAPLLPPPIPPHLAYKDFGLAPEVLPFQHRSDKNDGVSSRRATEDGPRLRDITNTIIRISNGPFDPTGDAPIWYSLGVQSSSIFKPTVFHNRSLSDERIRDRLRPPSREVERVSSEADNHIKREATGELDESSAHVQNPWTTLVPPSGSMSTRSLSIRKRPAMDLHPQVAVSAGVQAGWHGIGSKRKREDEDREEEAVGRQQSSKDDGGASPIPKRFAMDRVFSASSRRAAKRTGHSFGFPFWMERIEFEKRGRELGEL